MTAERGEALLHPPVSSQARQRQNLPQRRRNIPAVHGGHIPRRPFRQRVVQERLRDVLRGDLQAEQVAGHVVLFRETAGRAAAGDHLVGQEAGADAVGVDGVGADAEGAVVQRVLAGEE